MLCPISPFSLDSVAARLQVFTLGTRAELLFDELFADLTEGAGGGNLIRDNQI